MVVHVNKKGFMFIETIVMCAILMVGLLFIYKSYTASIAKEKQRLNYISAPGTYRLYFLKKYLVTEMPSIWGCDHEGNCPSVLDTSYLEKELENSIGDAKEIYNIEKLVLLPCDYSGNYDEGTDFGEYIKSLKKCDYKYRLVAEFKEDNETYSYAWIGYPVLEGEDEA